MDAVDLALVLALDGSASVGFDEFGLIAGGCAAGLRDPDVVAGLTGGPRGGSLCTVLLWSGHAAQAVLVPWTRLGSPTELAAFAALVEDIPRSVVPGTTAIGAALLACQALLAMAPAASHRQVIDVAGDGRSNDGTPPGPVRDALVQAGVTVNGLCVLHEEPDLVRSYEREVIGGPDRFALGCPDYPAFADAMRRKLLREASLS